LYATVFAFVSAVDAVVVVARALVIVWRRSILSRPREAGERSNWRQKRRAGALGFTFYFESMRDFMAFACRRMRQTNG
jgi:hypothetical protein